MELVRSRFGLDVMLAGEDEQDDEPTLADSSDQLGERCGALDASDTYDAAPAKRMGWMLCHEHADE